MNSKTVKQFIKDKFGLTVKVRTINSKAGWINAWIPSTRTEGNQLIYTQIFPGAFRQACIKVVYPNSTDLQTQFSAGNIDGYSISMLPHQWEQVINEWKA